jgi:hypothetical protein
MTATLNVLKGQLKLDLKLSAIADKGNKKGNNKAKKTRTRRTRPTGMNRIG